jgi:hypothetical protein
LLNPIGLVTHGRLISMTVHQCLASVINERLMGQNDQNSEITDSLSHLHPQPEDPRPTHIMQLSSQALGTIQHHEATGSSISQTPVSMKLQCLSQL